MWKWKDCESTFQHFSSVKNKIVFLCLVIFPRIVLKNEGILQR